MAAAANGNLQIVSSSVLQREPNVVCVFHEGNNTSIALRIGGPPSYSLAVSLVTGGHNIPFEGLLELGETRHPRRELTAGWHGVVLYPVLNLGVKRCAKVGLRISNLQSNP